MKGRYFAFCAVLIGMSSLWSALNASEAATQTKAVPAVSKTVNQKAKSSAPRAGHKDAEVSPVFQVSADPRDQVWLVIRDGIVTVEGSVATEELARDLIKRFAQIAGTRQVRNRLTIRTNRDSAIAKELREVLSRDPATDAGDIAVTVYGGRVFLSGLVSSEQERARAEELARALSGVKKVSNGLVTSRPGRVTPRVTSSTRPTYRRR